MRSSTLPIVFTIALLGAQVYADPTEESQILAKRENVCALNLRGVALKDCLDNGKGTFFSWVETSTTVTSSSVTAIPPGSVSQCDHIVELQLLDSAMTKYGACDLIKKMEAAAKAAKTTVSKAALLQPFSDIINSHENLKFLATKVNNRKKTVVQRAIRVPPAAQTSENVDKAVGDYLRKTTTSSNSIAKQLDAKVPAIITRAEEIFKALPADSGRVTIKADLQKAITVAKATKTPVATEWNKVIAAAPRA